MRVAVVSDTHSRHATVAAVVEILSRREFNRVHGPNRFDIWWEKVVRWLNKFFGSHPITGNSGLDLWHILVYSAVVVAFVLFAVWLKKRFDFARADDHPRDIMPFAPSARSWRSWLAEARALAQKEDWRNGKRQERVLWTDKEHDDRNTEQRDRSRQQVH